RCAWRSAISTIHAARRQARCATNAWARDALRATAPSSRSALRSIRDEGKEPYVCPMAVDFSLAPNGVRLVLTLDPMHDEVWTRRLVAGWESELGKLEKMLRRLGSARISKTFVCARMHMHTRAYVHCGAPARPPRLARRSRVLARGDRSTFA